MIESMIRKRQASKPIDLKFLGSHLSLQPRSSIEAITRLFEASTFSVRAAYIDLMYDIILAFPTSIPETLSSSLWLSRFLENSLLSRGFGPRHTKSKDKVFSSAISALAKWNLEFPDLPLINSAISRCLISGFKIPDLAKEEKDAEIAEFEISKIKLNSLDLEISATLPELESCYGKIQSGLEILFPATLAEAFAGVLAAPHRGSAAVADSVSVRFNPREISENKIVFDHLRENFRIFRKKFAPKLKFWNSEILKFQNLEISNLQINLKILSKKIAEMEDRVVLLFSAAALPLPCGVDDEFLDDF